MTERVLVKGAYLWDGVQDRANPDGAVLVEGKLIKAVGSAAEISSLPQVPLHDRPAIACSGKPSWTSF